VTRADAARNRRLLIDAASAELSDHGLEASVAQIAARAGLAKGTFFNHFASKEDLVSALFCEQLAALAATGEALLEDDDPGSALLRFMTAGAEVQANDRSVCEAAAATTRADPEIRAAGDRLAEVAEALTARARQAGVVRPEITGHDIVLLLGAAPRTAAPVAAARPDLWRRYLHLIFDGLRPEGAHRLPVTAPTGQDFTTAAALAR
jgi:AcrR family transcriptional regulator